MNYNDYYNDINFDSLEIDWTDFEKESQNAIFKVLRFESDVVDDKDYINWFSYQNVWYTANINDITDCPNIKKIVRIFEKVMQEKYLDNNKIIQSKLQLTFLLTKANEEIIKHNDLWESSIALNIRFYEDTSPITFTDIGDVFYKIGLLNVKHEHMVKASSKDRLVFRITPLNQDYQYVCECFDKAGLLIKS